MTTIKQLLAPFSRRQIPELALLLGNILRKNSAWIFAHPDERLTWSQEWRWRRAMSKFRAGYSVAAITHHKEFFGLDFFVNKHTLIPRPETETLVELAIEKIRGQNAILIDVGTGSGCIPIAIVKMIKSRKTNCPVTAFALDNSGAALRVARRNTKQHHTPMVFFHGDLLLPIVKNSTVKKLPVASRPSARQTTPIIITANLPYLTPEQYRSEPTIRREPYRALVGGATGLELYDRLLAQIKQLRNKLSAQNSITLLFEIDPSQSEGAVTLIHKYFSSARAAVTKDLAGQSRVARADIV